MKTSAAFVLAALGTLSVNAWAGPADLYVGVDLFGAHSRFDYDYEGTGAKIDNDSSGFKLKFGALLINDLRLQGYLLNETFDDAPFDWDNDRLTEFGLDFIKEFVVSPALSPFIQGGFGFGSMDLDDYYYTDDYISEISFRLGMGVMLRITPNIELLGGIDLQWRRWDDVDYYVGGGGTERQKTEDFAQRYYVGIDFLF